MAGGPDFIKTTLMENTVSLRETPVEAGSYRAHTHLGEGTRQQR